MASILNFLHFCFLGFYFVTRYVISVLSFGKRELDDAAWFYSIEHLTNMLKACCYTIQIARAHPIWPSLVISVQIAWILWSASYMTIQLVVSADAAIIVLDAVADCFDEELLWKTLSEFIIFTKISGKKGLTAKFRFQASSPSLWRESRPYQILVTAMPWIIRTGFLFLCWKKLTSRQDPFSLDPHSLYTPTVFPSPSLPYRSGFTAKIPRCYDGDTCYSRDLSFNGEPLPDLFSTLNIRILGIDAPEIRSAKCDLERCLATRAKYELEGIVGAGSEVELSLVDCRHDKYGGRITCDIVTSDGKKVAQQMLETGLAIAYFGKRKEYSWCDVEQLSSLGRSRSDDNALQKHLLACGWDIEDGDDDAIGFEDEIDLWDDDDFM